MAKKNQLNVSIGVDGANYKKDWDKIASITQGAAKDLEKEAAKMALAVSKKIEGMNLNSQARQLQNLTARMMEAGMQGTKAFQQVASSAGKLKANIDDAKGVIEAFRPDAPFKALTTTLGAAAQGFAGVQGAMALFGAESEETQKVLLKVQAAMAFSEGFKALDGLQDGFTQLNLVIKANPLIAGVAAFAAVAATIAIIADNTSEAAVAQMNYNEVTSRAYDLMVSEKVELERLLKVYNSKETSDAERLRIQTELVNKYPKYLGQLSTEKVEQNKVNSGVKSYIKLLELKSKAQAAQELYVEALKEENKLRKEFKDIMSDDSVMSEIKWGFGFGADAEDINKAAKNTKYWADMFNELSDNADKAEKQIQEVVKNPVIINPNQPLTPTDKPSKIGAAADFTGFGSSSKGVLEYKKTIDTTTESLKSFGSVYVDNSATIARGNAMLVANAAAMREVKLSAEDLTSFIQAQLVSAITDMASALGEAVATGGDLSKTMGETFLLSLSGFMKQFGAMLVAAGVAKIALEKLAIPGGAVAAIAAGAALTAIGAGINASLKQGMPNKGFASGGLIGGNSFTGDRLLAPVNSGEVILNTGQQNALLRMANGGGGGGSWSTKFTGRELIIMYDNARRDLGRG